MAEYGGHQLLPALRARPGAAGFRRESRDRRAQAAGSSSSSIRRSRSSCLVSDGDRLLFVQRGAEPQIGKWCFPGGYVDRGEEVRAAARREVREETGLEVEITGLIGVYSLPSNPVIVIAYLGSVRSGELTAGTDAEDAGWFKVDGLPELAFPHNVKIIEDWEAAQRTG